MNKLTSDSEVLIQGKPLLMSFRDLFMALYGNNTT